MQPATHNLELYAGDDYGLVVTFTDPDAVPLNLSGLTFRSQVRMYESDPTIRASFTVDSSAASTGVIGLSLAKEITVDLGDGVWDLEQTDGTGKVQTLLAGKVTVRLEVTR